MWFRFVVFLRFVYGLITLLLRFPIIFDLSLATIGIAATDFCIFLHYFLIGKLAPSTRGEAARLLVPARAATPRPISALTARNWRRLMTESVNISLQNCLTETQAKLIRSAQ